MNPEPVIDYVLTSHAALEMARRGLSPQMVRSVLTAPEQRMEVRPGRIVFQSGVKIGKYWRD